MLPPPLVPLLALVPKPPRLTVPPLVLYPVEAFAPLGTVLVKLGAVERFCPLAGTYAPREKPYQA